MLGQQVVHVGDADAIKQLLASEHKLVEASKMFHPQQLLCIVQILEMHHTVPFVSSNTPRNGPHATHQW